MATRKQGRHREMEERKEAVSIGCGFHTLVVLARISKACLHGFDPDRGFLKCMYYGKITVLYIIDLHTGGDVTTSP